jgi:G3E family GTPase
MRIVLISGFLGSGKTTLLLRMVDYLRNRAEKGLIGSGSDNARSDVESGVDEDSNKAKIAIIENEIGSVNLDSKMLDGQGLTMREMLAGCICCSLQSNLAMSIEEICQTVSPDWLLIEATGLASAREVATGIRNAVDNSAFSSILSLALVDASRFTYLLERTVSMVKRQLEQIDVLVLNKIDLVSEDERLQTSSTLREMSPDTQIFEVSAENGIPDEIWHEIFREGMESDSNGRI